MNIKYFFILFLMLFFCASGIILNRWEFALLSIPFLLLLAERQASLTAQFDRVPLPPRVIEGSSTQIVINIRAEKDPAPLLFVSDKLPEGSTLYGGKNEDVFSLREGEEAQLRYTARLKRGHFTFGPLTVKASNLFGTSTKTFVVEKTATTIALSRFEEVAMPLTPKKHRGVVGIFPSRFVGRGSDFFSVRNYFWGDEQRVINWKATARTGKLKSNDYESERAVDALIVLDAREENLGKTLVLNHSISATLSIAYYLLREKNRVGLLIFSDIQYHVAFDYGKRQFLKMADILCGVTPKGRHSFRYVVGHLNRIPRKTFVIIVSPLLDPSMEEDIKRLYPFPHMPIIISPSPVELEYKSMPEEKDAINAKRLLNIERKLMLKHMSGHAKVVDWDPSLDLAQVLENLK